MSGRFVITSESEEIRLFELGIVPSRSDLLHLRPNATRECRSARGVMCANLAVLPHRTCRRLGNYYRRALCNMQCNCKFRQSLTADSKCALDSRAVDELQLLITRHGLSKAPSTEDSRPALFYAKLKCARTLSCIVFSIAKIKQPFIVWRIAIRRVFEHEMNSTFGPRSNEVQTLRDKSISIATINFIFSVRYSTSLVTVTMK